MNGLQEGTLQQLMQKILTALQTEMGKMQLLFGRYNWNWIKGLVMKNMREDVSNDA